MDALDLECGENFSAAVESRGLRFAEDCGTFFLDFDFSFSQAS